MRSDEYDVVVDSTDKMVATTRGIKKKKPEAQTAETVVALTTIAK